LGSGFIPFRILGSGLDSSLSGYWGVDWIHPIQDIGEWNGLITFRILGCGLEKTVGALLEQLSDS
jgi:hypothetical protein